MDGGERTVYSYGYDRVSYNDAVKIKMPSDHRTGGRSDSCAALGVACGAWLREGGDGKCESGSEENRGTHAWYRYVGVV